MELKPGLRLESATCDTQVVVVKAPKDVADVDVRCGGEPMRELGAGGDRLPVAGEGDATLLGKRYEDAGLGLELLCTQGGDGALTVGEAPLLVKGAKPLPSSD
ncbi:MAG: hypothetical protein R2702_15380 [Acidimicrobiales bacterium]